MSKRKPIPKTIEKASVMDTLVTGAPASAAAKEAESKQTRKEKEAARRKARAKNQVRYDLPPGMKAKLTAIANQYSVPPSHLAAFLLADSLGRLEDGEIDPTPYVTLHKSLKYDNKIELEDWPDL
jgi:hypothetical protein